MKAMFLFVYCLLCVHMHMHACNELCLRQSLHQYTTTIFNEIMSVLLCILITPGSDQNGWCTKICINGNVSYGSSLFWLIHTRTRTCTNRHGTVAKFEDIYKKHSLTLREESSQTNVILQYKLLATVLSAVCSVIQQS